MKAIKNIAELKDLFESENQRWQEEIYDKTGAILLLKGKDGTLFSNCGYIDLDYDAEYCSISGIDKTPYCEIHNIGEIIEYILHMEGYYTHLKDISIGRFFKSDLFWSAQERIIWAEENQKRSDGSAYQDWGLYSISAYQNHTEMHMALVDYDSTDIWLDLFDDTTLDQALEMLVNELNEIITASKITDVPMYRVIVTKDVKVPRTYKDLMNHIANGEFRWLL